MSPSTVNVRVAANRSAFRAERKRRLEQAIIRLNQSADFQVYMAHLLWGVLGLEKDDRGSEVARHRGNTAGGILGELTSIDHLGTRLIRLANMDRIDEEIEVLKDNATDTKEETDV